MASVGAVISLLALLFAYGLSKDPQAHPSTLLGHSAPDFTLKTLDGGSTVHLAALRGQVVVVNFWASWCAECHVEHGALAAAWDRYRDQGMTMVGVSFQDTTRDALAYGQAAGVSWPLVADPDSSTGLAFGISGVPETIFIGRDGRVAAKVVGPVSYGALSEEIGSLLGERGSG